MKMKAIRMTSLVSFIFKSIFVMNCSITFSVGATFPSIKA